MINDPTALKDVRDGWEFVRESRNVIVGNCNVATFAVGFNQAGIRNFCFNLLLASAFSVLEEVLRQLRTEGKFASKKDQLGYLMSASQAAVPWSDYGLIEKGDRSGTLAFINESTCPMSSAATILQGLNVSWSHGACRRENPTCGTGEEPASQQAVGADRLKNMTVHPQSR